MNASLNTDRGTVFVGTYVDGAWYCITSMCVIVIVFCISTESRNRLCLVCCRETSLINVCNFASGHHGNVYSASWSHGNPWLISCSSDHTARLWCLSQKDPLLTISHSQTNSKFQQKVGAMSGKAKQGSKVALQMLPSECPPLYGVQPFCVHFHCRTILLSPMK